MLCCEEKRFQIELVTKYDTMVGGSKSAKGGPYPLLHRDDISRHLKYYQLSSEILDYKLILFRSGHFDHDMEKNITVIGMF